MYAKVLVPFSLVVLALLLTSAQPSSAHCPYISLGEILTSNALSLLDEGESLLLEVTESSVTLGGSVLSFLFNSLGLRSTSSCNKTANLTPTSIELSGFNLYGEIPSLLGELPKLAQLDLSNNMLNGSIPSSMSALSVLSHLNLSNNLLAGGLSILSNLSSLVTADLSLNSWNETLPDLSRLVNLKTLNMSSSQLEGELPELSSLTDLISLDLSDNRLFGILPNLSSLVNLETLNLSSNLLNGTLPELIHLAKLEVLDLSKNDFRGGLFLNGELRSLTSLILSENTNLLSELTSLPLSSLPSLVELVIDNTGLAGPLDFILTEFVQVLQKLSLSQNLLCGTVPHNLSQIANFTGSCNFFFYSWCSNSSCSNFQSNSGPCNTSRYASLPEVCIIMLYPGTDEIESVISFPQSDPQLYWLHPVTETGQVTSLQLSIGFVRLYEINETGVAVANETFPTGGRYLIQNATTISNGLTIDEVVFQATLGNGANVSITYYITPGPSFSQEWGNISVSVPAHSIKYTFNIGGWPFLAPTNRLRLQTNIVSSPQPTSASSSTSGSISVFSLEANATYTIFTQLYNLALVYSDSGSVSQPSGATQWVNVNTSLSEDFQSVFIDFPYFGKSAVLSYDPSVGVLLGGNTGGSAQSSFSTTIIIIICVSVSVGVVVVLGVILGTLLAIPMSRRYWKKSVATRSMVNLQLEDRVNE